jgi:hypothetical protein
MFSMELMVSFYLKIMLQLQINLVKETIGQLQQAHLQIALDLDNSALYLGVNGTWRNSGNPTSGSSRTGAVNFSSSSLVGKFLLPAFGKGNQDNSTMQYNFGNGYFGTTAVSSAGTNASGIGIFEYDVPTGFTALSTKGLNL